MLSSSRVKVAQPLAPPGPAQPSKVKSCLSLGVVSWVIFRVVARAVKVHVT